MRTIRLTEHRPSQPEALAPEELRDLLTLPSGLLDISPRGSGNIFTIKPRSRIGTIVLPSVRVLIRPKVPLRNVFFLLAYANRIHWRSEDFPYEEDDLFRAIALWFDRECTRVARFGLVRDYIDLDEPLTTLRGRLAVERQIARRPGRQFPLECRYQDYSEDTALNRVVKAAHNVLLRTPGVEREVSIRLRHRARHVLGNVASVGYNAATLPSITITRLNRQWESAFRLASTILRRRSLRDERGGIVGTSFTVDMNVVFERFVQAFVQERARGTEFALEPQARRRLTSPTTAEENVVVPAIHMRPDLLLKQATTPVAVGDAKYKELLRLGDWEHPDIYQLIAYCVRLRLDRGLLVYAGKRPLTHSRVVGAPVAVDTVGVDLSGSPDQILQSATAAADVLVSHAVFAATTTAVA